MVLLLFQLLILYKVPELAEKFALFKFTVAPLEHVIVGALIFSPCVTFIVPVPAVCSVPLLFFSLQVIVGGAELLEDGSAELLLRQPGKFERLGVAPLEQHATWRQYRVDPDVVLLIVI